MGSVVAIKRTPEIIAAEINSIKDQTRAMFLNNSIEIGRRLCEAKECLPHGKWGTWLQESVDYSQSTANNLMRIFEEYGAGQLALFGETGAKSQALASLNYTQAVALLALPADEREPFIDGHDLDNMSTRELKQALEELKQERAAKDDLAVQLDETQNQINDLTIKNNELLSAKDEAESQARVNHELWESAKFDLKELQETLENEREQVQVQIEEAKAAGNNDEVKRLEEYRVKTDAELYDAIKKISELEEQLRAMPIDVPAVIEKIPDDVEKELEVLRAGQRSAAELKFKLQFDVLVKDFQSLLSSMAEIEEENQVKYKTAVSTLINKMSERL